MTALSNAVTDHYTSVGLVERILAALVESGADINTLTPEDLAPLDQFHVRGRDATAELAAAAGIKPKQKIIDVGGGIGGPARLLASHFGCDVTVVDLTEEYCRAGEILTQRTGLQDHVRFCHASALDMPFEDGSFDLAWEQHSSMNIEDKRTLYKEIARVLRPGGHLALYEIMQGESPDVQYPLPWARNESISHLVPPSHIQAALSVAGFRALSWVDQTRLGLEWLRERLAATQASGPPKLGLHLLVGDVAPIMFKNLLGNLERRSVVIIQAILEKS